MTTAKITNHVAQAKARLLSQYKDKERVECMIQAFSQGYQDIEECLFKMYYERSVNSAIGEQLDIIGFIVGQPRYGWDDDAYRVLILGKIGANISKGTPEELISMFKLLMKCTKAHYYPYYPAEVYIIGNFAPVDTEQLLIDGNMEAAGVADWTVTNDAVLTKETTDPHGTGIRNLRVAWGGTANPGASQIMLSVGQKYWLRGFVRNDGVATHVPTIYNGGVPIQALIPYGDWYDFDVIFEATSQELTLGGEFDEAGYIEYDSCACRRLLIDNLPEIYTMCEKVIPVGVKLIGIGWYNDDGHDDIWDGDDEDDDDPDDPDPNNVYFSFEGDPNGLGFGDILDPTVGGKFASLFVL